MRITVAVKASSKREEVRQTSPFSFVVAVRERPREGRANQAVIAALAEYFHVAPSEIELVHGAKGPRKIFEIPSG
jgi:uncharacterized protein YggU (UPF0235/DUF167 family)